MISKKSLQALDKVGYLGGQKKMTKKQYSLELKKSSEAMQLYKTKRAISKKAA
jgi:hypothetical protein